MSSICATQGATTYIATVDEAGLMARPFPGKSVGHLQPDLAYSNLVNSTWLGQSPCFRWATTLCSCNPWCARPGFWPAAPRL